MKAFDRSISRRSLLAGLIPTVTSQPGAHSMSQVGTFQLGHGIEVRDFRLFPSPDILRFIVEVHNTNDAMVDTPTVGVVLPHLDDEGNYGWASPIAPVLHPHTSGGLIGIAPSGLKHDSDWGKPEWMLCGVPNTILSERLSPWEIDISARHEVDYDQHLIIRAQVANLGDHKSSSLRMRGLLWDKNHRICGSTTLAYVPDIEPKSTVDVHIDVAPPGAAPIFDYIANPFTLVNTVEGMDVTMSLQPPASPTPSVCPLIMPWNR